MTVFMDTELKPDITASAICDALGRKRIAERVGRRTSAVSNAASDGVFPASWYVVIRDMCDEVGISCPAVLFSFVTTGDPDQPTEKDVA